MVIYMQMLVNKIFIFVRQISTTQDLQTTVTGQKDGSKKKKKKPTNFSVFTWR